MIPWDFTPQEEHKFFPKTSHVMTLSGALGTDAVEAFSKATGISESTLFLTAFGLALAKFTGQKESLFAAATSARTHPTLDVCVAMMVKMLPVYITLREGESSLALLERVQTEFHQTMSHDSVNIATISERCNIETVAQFVYQSDILSGIPHPKGMIPMEMIPNRHGIGSISFVGLKKSPQFSLIFDYQDDLYKAETIARFATLYEEILAWLMQVESQSLGE